jgi:hypothetical protein
VNPQLVTTHTTTASSPAYSISNSHRNSNSNRNCQSKSKSETGITSYNTSKRTSNSMGNSNTNSNTHRKSNINSHSTSTSITSINTNCTSSRARPKHAARRVQLGSKCAAYLSSTRDITASSLQCRLCQGCWRRRGNPRARRRKVPHRDFQTRLTLKEVVTAMCALTTWVSTNNLKEG